MITEEKAKEAVAYASIFGDEATIGHFCLTAETLARYKRVLKDDPRFNTSSVLRKLQDQYSDDELRVLAKGKGISAHPYVIPNLNFEGRTIKYAYITDTHAGSVYFSEKAFDYALAEIEREKCEFILHTGDISEGMSGREGHIYECTHLGFDRQREYIISLLGKCGLPWYVIDGNHDRWFGKKSGAFIVKDLGQFLGNVTFLGHDEGDLVIDGVSFKLWHGEDSSSYAVSYRVQKIIEAFTGGEKPQILHCGHTHKQLYMFSRNIHAVSGGALSKQSKWMRGKRLANHFGFWIIETCLGEEQVKWFSPRWYPFY